MSCNTLFGCFPTALILLMK